MVSVLSTEELNPLANFKILKSAEAFQAQNMRTSERIKYSSFVAKKNSKASGMMRRKRN